MEWEEDRVVEKMQKQDIVLDDQLDCRVVNAHFQNCDFFVILHRHVRYDVNSVNFWPDFLTLV